MSRWAKDPEGAADALVLSSLDDIPVQGRVLLVNQSRSLPEAVRQRGAECVLWNRRLIEGRAAAPWPPPGPFELAFVRLPKARDEQAMTVHAAMSGLSQGGHLVVYGGNDEGIRSAVSILETVAQGVATLVSRGHGRVLTARRSAQASLGLRVSLEAWRTVDKLEIAGARRDWVTYPGCFAAGRVDEGTGLLLSVLARLGPGVRVLDYGCGTGVISAALLTRESALKIDAMDNDAVALEAVRENAPSARRILGTRLADAGRCDYDAIVSNPPLHQGIAEDHAALERLVADAPSRLLPGGYLQLVVQRRVALERLLGRHFAKVERLAETGRYSVWKAQGAIRSGGY